jgi:hypothetical protein
VRCREGQPSEVAGCDVPCSRLHAVHADPAHGRAQKAHARKPTHMRARTHMQCNARHGVIHAPNLHRHTHTRNKEFAQKRRRTHVTRRRPARPAPAPSCSPPGGAGPATLPRPERARDSLICDPTTFQQASTSPRDGYAKSLYIRDAQGGRTIHK